MSPFPLPLITGTKIFVIIASEWREALRDKDLIYVTCTTVSSI